MNRRQFAAAGLATVALSATVKHAISQQQADETGAGHKEHDPMMAACAKACSDCQRACDMCSTHCSHLLAAGKKEHALMLATCQDCADTCVAAAQIVARGGPFAGLICGACADACSRCAKECEKFPNDAQIKMCAAECRKCEKACREMANMHK